ncbi:MULTISPECIES: ribonuclease P protein component [Cyanophyceae]|uniref:ribonuclease P protein component n=1 Tax=Cyanophyceae TaxID=3028117 RepID=UPI001686FD29|nr:MULTISPECIES: ribonuclease P protein component [unclassified Phormidium]MBD1914990.1 ribonuclease P protein component [Phormidium sp. FACHB-77]MBD2032777.1 ribonuclease P protein component [Phormidium sp. FACHB-322]MBD2049922.1 ribonuclease P protein component [Leptolyngbya sp. FACHB-60]
MLPKHHRLRRSRDFSQVYRQGRKVASAHLLMRAWSLPPAQAKPVTPNAHDSRIGIVVSLKVHKRAVVRNRLKRRVRAALRILLPRLRPSQWIVISLKPGAAECEYGEFLRELEQLFTKLEVFHGHS